MANSGQNISVSTFSYDYVRLLPKEQIGLHAQQMWELNYIIRGNGIRVASELLRQNPTQPINEIAYHSGFSDVPYVNRMFKAEFGVSPKKIREGI